MKLYGIKICTIKSEQRVVAEKYKFFDVKLVCRSFEGHQIPVYKYEIFTDTVTLKPNDFLVKTNQRTLEVIANLLESLSGGSFLAWEFLNTIFERKEYFETYSMEPVAEKMASENPKLKEEFLQAVNSDEKLRNNPYARFQFLRKVKIL